MFTIRPWLLLILSTLPAYGRCDAAASPETSDWTGHPLPRISRQEQSRLRPSLSKFFGNAEGDTGSPKQLPGAGPSLFSQFWAAMAFPINLFQFRLPSDRLIWAYWDKNSGAWVVVIPGTTPSGKAIAATALLTNLCPRNGVIVNARTDRTNGRAFQMHRQCEPDSSLMVFYAHGDIPDPNLNADLSKWAQASVEARQRELANVGLLPWLDRKLLMKIFVRVLDGRAIDMNVPDTVFPLNLQAVAGE